MKSTDKQPLSHHPAYASISKVANNRLGAVYSALHSFWSVRAALSDQTSVAGVNRCDAYSVILFNRRPEEVVQNDFNKSPDQLLLEVLPYGTGFGTNFNKALTAAEKVMQQNWSRKASC